MSEKNAIRILLGLLVMAAGVLVVATLYFAWWWLAFVVACYAVAWLIGAVVGRVTGWID